MIEQELMLRNSLQIKLNKLNQEIRKRFNLTKDSYLILSDDNNDITFMANTGEIESNKTQIIDFINQEIIKITENNYKLAKQSPVFVSNTTPIDGPQSTSNYIFTEI